MVGDGICFVLSASGQIQQFSSRTIHVAIHGLGDGTLRAVSRLDGYCIGLDRHRNTTRPRRRQNALGSHRSPSTGR